jgi:uncharacterized protein YndB with AHSA1/START domain
MTRQEAQARIDASPAEVWKVLIDIGRYPEWNRYASSAVGDLRPGGEVKIVVPLWKEKRGPVNNRVTELVANERLCWRSLSWFKIVAYGVRCRILEGQADGTTLFREVETMHGPLAGLIHRLHGPHLLQGLQTECDSLKEEVERQVRAVGAP